MRVLVPLMLLMVALAGCEDGGTDPDDGMTDTNTATTDPGTSTATASDTATATTTDTGTAGSPRDPVTWDLEVADNSFPGGSITIQVGDTVRWTQTGNNPHSVTARDGTFDSHPNCLPLCMSNGGTFEFTFDEVGSWEYYCRVHGSMVETITVEAVFDGVPE